MSVFRQNIFLLVYFIKNDRQGFAVDFFYWPFHADEQNVDTVNESCLKIVQNQNQRFQTILALAQSIITASCLPMWKGQ